jgi:hypothetical protein
VHEYGAAGHVDGGVRQRLVHRDEGVAEPEDAALVAERLPHACQHDRGVLDGVVALDLDVAPGVHGQVEAGVAAPARQMWSKNGTPVSMSSDRCRPDRSRRTMSDSRVLRSTFARGS